MTDVVGAGDFGHRIAARLAGGGLALLMRRELGSRDHRIDLAADAIDNLSE